MADQKESFSSGFLLGFFAGATEYFLFKTREGQDLRKKFADEWIYLRDKLDLEDGEENVPDNMDKFVKFIMSAKDKFQEFALENSDKKDTKKRTKKKLFRGV